MKGIYLASFVAHHPSYDMDYNDIEKTADHVNVIGDMLSVDLTNYDYVIATPPCNYWSRANYRREHSDYALKTKHLLPDIIKKLIKIDKPFLVENVRNRPLFKKHGLYNLDCFVYEYGRHTYWTNVMINFNNIKQKGEIVQNINPKERQGGENVYKVVEHFLEVIHEN